MMKALSLTQPWATLIVLGAKRIETRSWATQHRGPFAVHAAKGFPGWAKDLVRFDEVFRRVLVPAGYERPEQLPTGCILGVAEVAACLPTNGAYLKYHAANVEVSNGQIVSAQKVEKVDYQRPAEGTPEFRFGDYSARRHMFFLENVRRLAREIECSGKLSIWEVPGEVEAAIIDQLGEANLFEQTF